MDKDFGTVEKSEGRDIYFLDFEPDTSMGFVWFFIVIFAIVIIALFFCIKQRQKLYKRTPAAIEKVFVEYHNYMVNVEFEGELSHGMKDFAKKINDISLHTCPKDFEIKFKNHCKAYKNIAKWSVKPKRRDHQKFFDILVESWRDVLKSAEAHGVTPQFSPYFYEESL